MRQLPTSIALFGKPDSSRAETFVIELKDWFSARGVQCRELDCHASAAEVAEGVRGCNLALVAGGDGSMIAAGRRLLGLGVPMLGINLGTLGFLTEIPATQWQQQCEMLLTQGFSVHERLALSLRLLRKGEEIALPDGILPGAVNDIIFSRTTLARVISLNVRLDGQPFTHLRGDGLLISTPVGSSGYASSAGGVLLHPRMQAIEIIPVCPALHASHPFVAPGDTVIAVSHAEPVKEIGITLDGQDCFLLEPGDSVEVRAAGTGTLFASVCGMSYWRQLAAKGFVTPPPGGYGGCAHD